MSARNLTGISTTRVLAVLAAAGAAGAVLAGCTPDEHPSDVEGTRPAVLTGDQVVPGDEVNAGAERSGGAAAAVATIRDVNGVSVGTASFGDYDGAVNVKLRLTGLAPGVHGVHIHSAGKCEASTKFASAGDHFQAPGHTGKPESGDLVSVTVLKDGTGTADSVTDAFTIDQVRGKALVVHEVGDTDGTDRVACGLIQSQH